MEQIFREVPESLKALTENHQNLENVAQYCSENYLQTLGGPEALGVTRQLLAQALASVAFQINSVSESLLRLLDLQQSDLRRLESSVSLLSQSVEMHKEKVSRRLIGAFTCQGRVSRGHKLLPPTDPKPRPPYVRQPISFQLLDAVGHGVKVGGNPPERGASLGKPRASFRSKSLEPAQNPTAQNPTAPPVGSFGRPVAPPSVPSSWKAPLPCDVIEPLPLSDVMDEPPLPDEPLAPPPPPPPNHTPAQTLDLIGSSVAVAPPPPPPAPHSALAPPAPPPAPPSALAPPSPPLAPPSALASPPPPPALPSALAPPPPPPALPSALAPPPAPLETVLEESSFPPPPDDITEATPLSLEDTEAPPPPPPPPITEETLSFVLGRSRHRAPPTVRSHSLRVRSGPASRCFTRSLFLPLSQSLMIPPPPSFPPPTAPPTWPRPLSAVVLPGRLQHLDLEIPPPPPLIHDQD